MHVPVTQLARAETSKAITSAASSGAPHRGHHHHELAKSLQAAITRTGHHRARHDEPQSPATAVTPEITILAVGSHAAASP